MADQLPSHWQFHHLGHACKDMAASQAWFAALGYRQEGETFSDETQGIRGCFLVDPDGRSPRVELLENLPGRDTLTPWLDAGTRLYHMAYEVPAMDEALAWSRGQRGIVTVQPVPAIAFGGRRIAFVMFRHGVMLEFIEQPALQASA